MPKLNIQYEVKDSEPLLSISNEGNSFLLDQIYFSISHVSENLEKPSGQPTQLSIYGKKPVLAAAQALQFLYPQINGDLEFNHFIEMVRSDKYKKVEFAPKDKSIKDYKPCSPQRFFNGSHKVTQLEKLASHPKIKFFKENSDSEVNQAEAFVAAIYRLLIGCARIPKVRNLLNLENVSIGVIADEIKGYHPFPGNQQTSQQYIESGLIPIILASYILDEEDFHFGNFGFDDGGEAQRLDFDRSLDEVRSFLIQKNLLPIDSNILKDFPTNAEAHYRVLSQYIDRSNSEFTYQKWKYFLKFAALIDSSVISSIAKQFFSSDAIGEKYVNYIFKRLTSLNEALQHIPEFADFYKNNPQVEQEIIDEFNKYNSDVKYKKEFIVDINDIKNNLATHKKFNPPAFIS